MCPFLLYHRDPHCGHASLGAIMLSYASPLLTFAHGPEYHKPSKSITKIALPKMRDPSRDFTISWLMSLRISHFASAKPTTARDDNWACVRHLCLWLLE